MVNRLRNARDKERKKGFVYQDRDPKEMKRRSEQTGNNFDSIFRQGIDTWRPGQGDNTVRILPPTWDDPKHYGYDIWVHGWVGADRSSYLCPKKMLGKRCPICEEAKASRDAGEDDEAKQLEPKQNLIVWILDRDGDTDTPMVWQQSWTIDRDITAQCVQKKSGKVLQIDHPDDGYDISFKRQGTGLKTKYFGFQVDRDPSPIADKEKDQDEILDYINDNPLPDVLKFYDEEYLEKMIAGTAEAKDEAEDDEKDDDRGGRRGRGRDKDEDADEGRGSRRGRGRDAEDDDDKGKDDDRSSRRRGRGDDDDKGEEEDRPSRRRGRDAEPDEEEKPRGRVRVQPQDDDDKGEEEKVEDDDKGSRRRSRDADDDKGDDDDRGSRRRGRDDDDDKGSSRRRGRDADDEPEERGSRRRGRDDDNEGDDKGEEGDDREDDRPSRRGGSRRGGDDAEEERGSRRRGRDDDAEEERGSRRRR
jgi:hypothetical protein